MLGVHVYCGPSFETPRIARLLRMRWCEHSSPHPEERTAGPRLEGWATHAMTCNYSACTRSRAPREDSRGIAFDSAGATLKANPRGDRSLGLSFTGRLLNMRVRRRFLAGED